jgi:hypothetical protein
MDINAPAVADASEQPAQLVWISDVVCLIRVSVGVGSREGGGRWREGVQEKCLACILEVANRSLPAEWSGSRVAMVHQGDIGSAPMHSRRRVQCEYQQRVWLCHKENANDIFPISPNSMD